MLTRSLLILAVAALPALGQANTPAPDFTSPVTVARFEWKHSADFIVQAATEVPEATYSFRPTPEVRTFGELIGHVAGSQYVFCAAALGDKQPAEDAVEKSAKTKAALVDALKKSNDYCARAYNQTDKVGSTGADFFGEK